jgi:16S rRNA (guanine(966)-N(2))-methyltransferase RsmD
MPRVIAGAAKGCPLVVPSGTGTRPTADRIKESVFNILAPRLPGARVLDLFCGTGAFGIEALSRGAAHAVFVDSGRTAAEAVERNLRKTGLADRALFLGRDALTAVRSLLPASRAGGPFDLVFLDPPYAKGLVLPVWLALAEGSMLAPGCLSVIEAGTGEALEGPWTVVDRREYGRTSVWFVRAD